MKFLKTTLALCIVHCTSYIVLCTSSFSQCLPMIKIDGNDIIADENNSAGIKLPSWLKATQTLAKGQYVFSIAVIEFTVNGTALDYSQNLSVTTVQTVPANKVWKIESIHKDATIAIPPAATTYSTAGTYTFSPTCNGTFRIQVSGGGGGGGGGEWCWCGNRGGSGGGGGGYSEGNYYLLAGTTYTIIVGAGGAGAPATTCPSATGTAGGSSSVSVISVSATGGIGGNPAVSSCAFVSGGAGGTGSGGQINVSGQTGASTVGGNGSNGGASGNGGAGGAGGAATGGNGGAPGGGGAGGAGIGGVAYGGGAGAAGRVVISMSSGGGSGGSGSGSRDKLQASNVINAPITTACGYFVPFGNVFRLDGVLSTTTSTLYFGTTCGATGDRGQMTINSSTSSGNNGTTIVGWPYPQWFVGGTYFYYASGTAYIHGVEYTIDQ